MPIPVIFNNTGYTLPAQGDSYAWGTGTTSFLAAVAANALAKSGGDFPLLSEIDFGAAYGVKALYHKSRSITAAQSGVFRLGNLETVSWRNATNTADLGLSVNASNALTFNGVPIGTGAGSVVSVSVAAGSTKLTSSGSPITTSGTITFDVAEGNLTLNNIGGTLNVDKGGTGTAALTGYVKGTGTAALSAVASIPATDISGTIDLTTKVSGVLPISSGGTGTGTAQPNTQLLYMASGALSSSVGLSFNQATSVLTLGSYTIGQSTPSNVSLQTTTAGDGTTATIKTASSTQTNGSTLSLSRTRGTYGIPTNLTTSDRIGAISFDGYDTAALNQGAEISTYATQTWSSTARGTALNFSVSKLGATTPTSVLSIAWDPAGSFGPTYTFPSAAIFKQSGAGGSWYFQNPSGVTVAAIPVGATAVTSTDLLRLADLKLTTKGDLLTYGAGAIVRMGVGTNNYVLAADSTQTNGITWKDARVNSYTYGSFSTGFTTTIADDKRALIISLPGTIATGTVVLPAAPADGQIVSVSCLGGNITALTVSAGTSAIFNAPTTLTAGLGFSYIFQAGGAGNWYRLN